MPDDLSKDYKPDFDILDRYINFSSELLRISLLAMGGFGALVFYRIKEPATAAATMDLNAMFASVVLFALCAGVCLFHRFYASDTMSWYIAYLRAKENNDQHKQTKERDGLHRMLKRSSYSLILAEFIFGLAVVSFAFAVHGIIYNH